MSAPRFACLLCLLLAAFAPQRRNRSRSDVAVTGGFGIVLERVRHSDQPGIVPCAPEELDTDRLVMVVKPHRKDDSRNAVGSSRRVAAAEAGSAAASVIHADFAEQPRVDDGIHALLVGPCGIHPRLHHTLTM